MEKILTIKMNEDLGENILRVNVKGVLQKKSSRDELDYPEFEYLKNLAGNIAKSKINCKTIIERLNEDGYSKELVSKYEDMLKKIDVIYQELGEDLIKYKLI